MAGAKDVVTGVVYTRNIESAVIPAGVDGPLGDSVIVSGFVYRNPDTDSLPIGTFDIISITTSIGDVTERRQVSIELSFNKRFAKRSWISELDGPFKKLKQPAEVSLNGIETFPIGRNLPGRPIGLGVTKGAGPFVGVEEAASILYARQDWPIPEDEIFPLGGGLLDSPINFGVTTGTGPFAGVEGTASIVYDRETEFFTYSFNLA
jgi:hypothetical protein